MATIGKGDNNNMYPIAMAVVEVEAKDSWTWFLEAFVADLGPTPTHGWTFISDRQKVSIILVFIFHLTNFHMSHLYQSKSDIFSFIVCVGPHTKPPTCVFYG
jgi:hypothetical protein